MRGSAAATGAFAVTSTLCASPFVRASFGWIARSGLALLIVKTSCWRLLCCVVSNCLDVCTAGACRFSGAPFWQWLVKSDMSPCPQSMLPLTTALEAMSTPPGALLGTSQRVVQPIRRSPAAALMHAALGGVWERLGQRLLLGSGPSARYPLLSGRLIGLGIV